MHEFEKNNYVSNWVENVSTINKNGYQLLLIPKGSYVYVASHPYELAGRHYFGILETATKYIVNRDVGRSQNRTTIFILRHG